MTTAIVPQLHKYHTTLHTQEVHIPVSRSVSTGGEMKAGLGHKWDTHCLQHDINNMMFTTSWSTQCLNMHCFQLQSRYSLVSKCQSDRCVRVGVVPDHVTTMIIQGHVMGCCAHTDRHDSGM